MSKETWLRKFYQIPAERLRDASAIECIDHSILKWQGTLPTSLTRHKVKFLMGVLQLDKDSESLLILSGKTCALCAKYYDKLTDYPEEACNTCPIVLVTGKDCANEYSMGVNDLGVKPMLSLLRKVRRQVVKWEKNDEN